MNKKSVFTASYLGVAAVWLGGHFGPGFATGAFSVQYYVKYGWIGLITPLLAMLVTGGVMYYMVEYARSHGTTNYRPFALSCYGKSKGNLVSVLYDIIFIITVRWRRRPGLLRRSQRFDELRFQLLGARRFQRLSFPRCCACTAQSCCRWPQNT